jgi:hypothetical protein
VIKNIPFSRILLIPLVLFILVLGYIILKNDWIYLSPGVGAGLIAVAVVFVFSPQIDWWWWYRFTPSPDPRILKLFATHRPEYNALNSEERSLFHKRLFLYIKGKDFDFMDIDREPEDIKAIAAFYPLMLTLHQKEFLLDPYDKIVFFQKRFSSPAWQKPHVSELHEEDKVLIFSMEQLAAGFTQPSLQLDAGLYEFSRVYASLYLKNGLPIPAVDWPSFEKAEMWTPTVLHLQYGNPEADTLALLLCNGTAFPKAFRDHFPEQRAFLLDTFPFYRRFDATFS